jgi:spore maturation protein CgeB
MRIVIVDTCYPNFLASHYAARPELERATYEEQWSALMRRFFGTSDSYSHFLGQHGHAAHEFIVNCTPLQERWAAEHAVSVSAAPFRGDRRRQDAILLAQVEAFAPDVCHMQNLEVVSTGTLNELRRRGYLVTGQLSTEAPAAHRLRQFDLLVSPLPFQVDDVRALGVRCEHLPLAFDTRAAEEAGPRPSNPPFGAVFVGSLKRYRWSSNRVVARAARRVPIDFWGYGARQWPPWSPVRRRYHGNAWGLEMLRILRDARIGVNRHGNLSGPIAANMRLFEATGMGTLLLTDAKDNLSELFDVGSEVVAYADENELVEAIRHYLVADDERRAIAAAGQARTFADHSYYRRMARLADLIQDARGAPTR